MHLLLSRTQSSLLCKFALTIRFSLFAIRYLLLASFHFSISPTPDEERAERRWRSDACEGTRMARRDRRADASLDRQPGEPALRSWRTTGEPLVAIDFANRRAGLRETSCVPSDGTLAFRRSTCDF